MNYLIQRGKVRQQAINVPEGLPELLSDITREVLRCQPTKECLCQFIIDYLHSVIVAREKAMVAKSILDRALRQVDSIISDLCVCDLSNEKSNEMAQVIEDCFRNFLEKRRCEMRRGKETIKFADIDMLEELIMKCKFTEQELDSSRPAIESAYKRFVDAYMAAGKDTHGTELLYQYFRDRELKRIEENLRNKAATTIQAAFRGYLVRSMMAEHICVCTCRLEKQDQEELERMNNAARVIQRFFRYVLTRHDIKKMDDPCQEKETAPSKEETISAAAATDAAAVAESKVADVPIEAAPTTEPEDKSEPKPEEPKAEEVTAAPTEAAPAADSAPPPAEEASAPPAGDAAPPVEEAAPPAEEAAPPVEAAAPPAEAAAPPAEEAAPPAEADASPAEAAAPPAEAAPPPEEAAPPPEEAPPAEEVPVAE